MAFLKFNKAELVNLSYSLKREIILANKSGACCNTSIVTCNTRRYHGLLSVPVDAFGGGMHLLLSSLDETLVLAGKRFNLGIHCYGDIYEPRGHKYIVDFQADPAPRITYRVGETEFVKSLVLSHDNDQVFIRYDLVKAPSSVKVELKPFLAFRSVHNLTFRNADARTAGTEIPGGMSFRMYEGFPDLALQLSCQNEFKPLSVWYEGVTYSDEYRRGFDCREDLLVPGHFEFTMKPGDSVVFSAAVGPVKPSGLKLRFASAVEKMGAVNSLHDILLHQADLLIRNRGGRKQITAGFSWLYTGLLRETLIALPGLTLYADGSVKNFEEILDNLIEDEQERLFHRTTQVEAPLRMIGVIQHLIEFTGNEKKVWEKYGQTLKGIVQSYAPGHRKEVAMQPNGLLWAQLDGVCLSWINAYVNGRPVNERAGYQIETNAFWYNAVAFTVDMERRYAGPDSPYVRTWAPVKDLILKNFQPMFWNAGVGYFADYVDNSGQNLQLRPNQLWAFFLNYSPVDDDLKARAMRVIDNELVTRRGIRSLSPRDPGYKGVYEGNQIERDLAYYNGCARPSLLGPYVSVCFKMRGPSFLKKAEWLIEGFFEDLPKHGVGAFSELYDGDPPHEPHGTISSALSTAALLRVSYLIDKYREP